ncbi:MAG: NAD(P)H-dependent oxidoreductase [Desulfovibrionaceae bacterium]
MFVPVILAHPDPASLNAALALAAADALVAAGHATVLHDLCAEGFDPLLPVDEIPRGSELPAPIRDNCAELARADGLVVVHPNWWGMPPAVLTGWVDRVFRPGLAYAFEATDSGEGVPRPMLALRAVVVLNTANTFPEREAAVFGDPLERIWRDCVFGLCSRAAFYRRTFAVVCTSTPAQRAQWLAEAARLVTEAFPPEPLP